MNKLFAISIGLVLLVLLLLFSTTYTVAYHEVAIKTTFGQTGEGDASVIRDPGLKFKLPFFADRVKHLDTRVQLTESPLKTMPTADKQQVEVKAFLLWRVDTADTGPIEFMRSFATQADAEDKIKGQLEAALGAVSRFRFDDILGRESKMAAIEAAVLDELRRNLSPGVNAEMIGFSQIALASKTTTGVLGRMKADLEALAEAERAKGTAEAERIVSEAKTKADKIRAFATQAVASIRNKGNAAAAEYYRQMNEDPELAIFLAWLDALEQSLGSYTTFVVETAQPPFHLMDLKTPVDAKGVPQPPAAAAAAPAPERVAAEAPDEAGN